MSREQAIKIDEGMMRIADEIICHTRWQGYVGYAKDLYGENAYEIEATTTSQYDDEGGYFDSIEGIRVKDRAGNILDFDYSTAFLKQELEGVSEEDREAAAEDLARTYWADLFPTPEALYVDQEPKQSFTEIYVVMKDPN